MNPQAIFSTDFEVDPATDNVTVVVVGEFESASVAVFDATAQQVLARGAKSATLDLAQVDLIDSAAIGAIMRFRQALTKQSAILTINAPREYQQELFKITGLSHILDEQSGE